MRVAGLLGTPRGHVLPKVVLFDPELLVVAAEVPQDTGHTNLDMPDSFSSADAVFQQATQQE